MGCTVQSMLRSGRSARILGCEVHSRGRTPHGVRGLKCDPAGHRRTQRGSRTPHGVRGLKYPRKPRAHRKTCRTPHGVRGLKYVIIVHVDESMDSRTPHGVRGLKYVIEHSGGALVSSYSSRGAWIEILGTDLQTILSSRRTLTPCKAEPSSSR